MHRIDRLEQIKDDDVDLFWLIRDYSIPLAYRTRTQLIHVDRYDHFPINDYICAAIKLNLPANRSVCRR